MKTVEIFTDGACRNNPGDGGWGAVMRFGDTEKEICGGEPDTTNNRMEIMAAIQALEALKQPVEVVLTTDSQYLRQGITQWMSKWKVNGWKTAARKPVKNADLWKRLDVAAAPHKIRWEWTRGHSGHPDNERADRLANKGLEQARSQA